MPHAVVIAMYFLRDGSGREGGSKGFKRTDSTWAFWYSPLTKLCMKTNHCTLVASEQAL